MLMTAGDRKCQFKILQTRSLSTVQDLGIKVMNILDFRAWWCHESIWYFKVAQSLINNYGPAIEYTSLIGPHHLNL